MKAGTLPVHGYKLFVFVTYDLFLSPTPIGPLDTLIATHALALNALLMTNNVKKFQRVHTNETVERNITKGNCIADSLAISNRFVNAKLHTVR